MQTWTVRAIGLVHSPFSEAHQVPRGLGARHEEKGILDIFPEFEPGLKDVEGFSHLYILWLFDRSHGYELVGTPPCDTEPHGVFASRSPYRPNPIGLTVVRLLGREGNRLHVQGVDMAEGTPILDIKPYLSSVPEPELKRGWLAEAERRKAEVHRQAQEQNG
jgi:tRNA (adenine37-N6)-methyltransferase